MYVLSCPCITKNYDVQRPKISAVLLKSAPASLPDSAPFWIATAFSDHPHPGRACFQQIHLCPLENSSRKIEKNMENMENNVRWCESCLVLICPHESCSHGFLISSFAWPTLTPWLPVSSSVWSNNFWGKGWANKNAETKKDLAMLLLAFKPCKCMQWTSMN